MQPDVLLIVCDTARVDAFAPWGGPVATPVISRLAAQGVRYVKAISAAPWTLPAHGSIFTGALPTEHGIVGDRLSWTAGGPSSPAALTRSFQGPWLPRTMSDRGYRTIGVSCNPWIGRWGGFDRGFTSFVDVMPRTASASTAGRVRRWAGRVRQMARGGGHGGDRALDSLRAELERSGRGPARIRPARRGRRAGSGRRAACRPHRPHAAGSRAGTKCGRIANHFASNRVSLATTGAPHAIVWMSGSPSPSYSDG
jgi:arylsulfatase A-like enzyme